MIRILNFGLDRALLDPGKSSEAQDRQRFYARGLPARIVHIVKAPPETPRAVLELGDHVTVIPARVSHWAAFPFAAASAGRRALAEESFDVIQAQDPYFTAIPALLLSSLKRLPLVLGVYSDEIDNPVWIGERALNRVANRFGRFILKRAAAVRTDSESVAKRLSAGGCSNVEFVPFLITNAKAFVADHPAAPAKRKDLLGGAAGPLLLAVSRLEPEKNIPLLLNAVGDAVSANPELVLAIAGEGRLRAQLEDLASRICPGRVRWLGFVPQADLAACYQAADLTLLSSDRESSARVLSESLLAGTPVLTTDTAGAREIMAGEWAGRIVPVGDRKAFADALIALLADPLELDRMGKTARDMMKARFSEDAMLEKIRRLLTRAIAGRS